MSEAGKGGTPDVVAAAEPPPSYAIEARSLKVAGIAGHDYWVLRGPDGSAMAELHGLATDRGTGRAIPIGTDAEKHSLRIWHYVHDQGLATEHGVRTTRETYVAAGQPARTVVSGERDEVLARWNAAVAAKAPLDALDLDYPPYGFKVFGETVNSNSAYRTLGEIMAVPVRDFPGRIEPGIGNRMTTPEAIQQLRTHPYPVPSEAGPLSSALGHDRLPSETAPDTSARLVEGAQGGEAAFADALRALQDSPQGRQFQQDIDTHRIGLRAQDPQLLADAVQASPTRG